MCVCIFVIPQDLWRCPCPSESSGLTPLASLLCPAPPIMNGCMKAAVFVGTRRKIPDFPTSHVQVCLIWCGENLEELELHVDRILETFPVVPIDVHLATLHLPPLLCQNFQLSPERRKNISNPYFLIEQWTGLTWSCLSWLRRVLCGMRGLSETGWTCNKEESCCCDYILS